MPIEQVKEKLVTAVQAGCDFAVASRGDKGSLFYNGEIYVEQEAFFVKPIDTMGAGDSLITGFLIDLLKKNALFTTDEKSIKESLVFGAKKASETCRVNGTFGYGKDF